jgi:transposase
MEYYGLDVHKRYTVYTRLDEGGQVLGQGRITNDPASLAALVAPSGGQAKVVLEAGGVWPVIADALEGLTEELVLAHPLKTRAIASARIKTDRIDSAMLAHLLRTDLVPRSYRAPAAVRQLREFLRYRAGLVKVQTSVKNRVHAVLALHGVSSPVTDLFGRTGRAWLQAVELPDVARQTVDGLLTVLDVVKARITEANRLVRQRAMASPEATRLQSIPGVGWFGALLILAEVGDVKRFPDPRHFVSYAGLVPSVRSSGGHTRYGHITKEGSPWLRWIFIEAATTAPRRSPELRDRYLKLARRKDGKTARVALARHLASVAYLLLTRATIYQEHPCRQAFRSHSGQPVESVAS